MNILSMYCGSQVGRVSGSFTCAELVACPESLSKGSIVA